MPVTRRVTFVLATTLFLCLALGWAQNQPAAPTPLDGAAIAKAVAPYVNDQTLVVGHIDFALFNVDGFRASLLRVANAMGMADPERQKPITDLFKSATSWVAEFRDAGGRHLYFTVNLDSIPTGPQPIIIAPCETGGDPAALAELLQHGNPKFARVKGNTVFAGENLDTLAEFKPSAMPDLEKAFAAGDRTAAQLVLIPSGDSRRVVEELMPTLPAELGGGPSTSLTKGLSWATLAVSSTPAPSARLRIQSADAASAQALRATLVAALDSARKMVEADANFRRQFPKLDLDAVIKIVTPIQQADALALALDQAQLETVGVLLMPKFGSAGSAEQRTAGMSAQRALAIGCVVYASNHQNQFPDSLEILVDAGTIPAKTLTNPRAPTKKPGFIYRKPKAGDEKNGPTTPILYDNLTEAEAGGVWGVAFLDGHVEMFHKGTVPGSDVQLPPASTPASRP